MYGVWVGYVICAQSQSHCFKCENVDVSVRTTKLMNVVSEWRSPLGKL